mgnify:CR=1 FL=1
MREPNRLAPSRLRPSLVPDTLGLVGNRLHYSERHLARLSMARPASRASRGGVVPDSFRGPADPPAGRHRGNDDVLRMGLEGIARIEQAGTTHGIRGATDAMRARINIRRAFGILCEGAARCAWF